MPTLPDSSFRSPPPLASPPIALARHTPDPRTGSTVWIRATRESSLATFARRGSGMLRANVRRKLFVPFAFEVPTHFFDRVASRRTLSAERPRAFGTTPASQRRHLRRLDPEQFPHRSRRTRSLARRRKNAGRPSRSSFGDAWGDGGGI